MNLTRHFRTLFPWIGATAILISWSSCCATPVATPLPGTGNFYIEPAGRFFPSVELASAREAAPRPAAVAAKPPAIRNVSPREGEVVAGTPTVITGTFDDGGGIGIDAKSVRIMLAGTDVTRNAIVTPRFFTYRADLKPGPYSMEVTAKDLSGNTVRHAWIFNVASEESTAAAALPLEILSHANNAEVGGKVITVSGRTAPDARIDVQLQAFSALRGLGLTQQVLNQSVHADRAGNFSFSFEPKVAVPGTRYELSFTAVKNDLRKETRLILFQQN